MTMSPKRPIRELLELCVQKGPHWNRYWKEFEARFGEKILYFILGELKRMRRTFYTPEDQEVIADLRQDVYIKLLRNDAQALRNFKGDNESRFLCYLHVISRRIVINYCGRANRPHVTPFTRLETRRTSSISSKQEILSATTETVDGVERTLLSHFLLGELRRCHRSQNQERDVLIFKLYYLEGKTAREISDDYRVGLRASGVDTVISRMKKKLISSLKK